MRPFLAFARFMDAVSGFFGWIAAVAVIASCAISAGNAVIRYGLNLTSNAWLEIQWYLFGLCVMFGASLVLRANEHVRVDLIYGKLSAKAQVWIDLLGLAFFLLPVMSLLAYLSWGFFVSKLGIMSPGDSIESLGLWPYLAKLFTTGETSGNSGGLIRWPMVMVMPIGFALIVLQGLAEIIKRIGWLTHTYDMDLHYERPLQ
jgi:TRAP-type mannitol/chloroaromatic compound transport system permease small subunit